MVSAYLKPPLGGGVQAATQTSREELHAEVEAMLRAARSDLALKQCVRLLRLRLYDCCM